MISTNSNLNENLLPRFQPPEGRPIDVAVAFLRHHLKDGSLPVAKVKQLASRAKIKPYILTKAKQMVCRSYLDGNWYVSMIKEDVAA